MSFTTEQLPYGGYKEHHELISIPEKTMHVLLFLYNGLMREYGQEFEDQYDGNPENFARNCKFAGFTCIALYYDEEVVGATLVDRVDWWHKSPEIPDVEFGDISIDTGKRTDGAEGVIDLSKSSLWSNQELYERTAYVMHTYIDPLHRGKGGLRVLYEALDEELRREGKLFVARGARNEKPHNDQVSRLVHLYDKQVLYNEPYPLEYVERLNSNMPRHAMLISLYPVIKHDDTSVT
jgi:GNAT superfamily N-acetyltransferase